MQIVNKHFFTISFSIPLAKTQQKNKLLSQSDNSFGRKDRFPEEMNRHVGVFATEIDLHGTNYKIITFAILFGLASFSLLFSCSVLSSKHHYQ